MIEYIFMNVNEFLFVILLSLTFSFVYKLLYKIKYLF